MKPALATLAALLLLSGCAAPQAGDITTTGADGSTTVIPASSSDPSSSTPPSSSPPPSNAPEEPPCADASYGGTVGVNQYYIVVQGDQVAAVFEETNGKDGLQDDASCPSNPDSRVAPP